MRSFWKVFVALALMLPLGAFVAGTLVASAADDPTPRDTIIIDDQSGTPSSDPTPDRDTEPRPPRPPRTTTATTRVTATTTVTTTPSTR